MAGITSLYSSERLKHPMKRVGERGSGKFERITWEEAMDIMETKLTELRDRGEAHKFTYSMFPHSVTDPKWRLSMLPEASFRPACLIAIREDHGHDAYIRLFSQSSHRPYVSHGAQGRLMILSGRHPFGCLDDAAVPSYILDAKERGAKLIVIDPIYRTEASKADWWIPIKPGGDASLFLGVCNYLLLNDLHDKKFCDKWVREGDMDGLMAYIKDKTPEA